MLNAIGALPGVGNIAKPAIKGAKVGLYRLASKKGETFEGFIERLSKNAATPAAKRQSITGFVTGLVDDGWLKGLSEADRDIALRAFRTIFAEGAEGYVARRVAQLQRKGAPEALQQRKVAVVPGSKDASVADLLIFEKPEQVRRAVRDMVENEFELASTLAIIAEIKAGRGTLSTAQKRIKAELERLGRADDFKELVVPLGEIKMPDLINLAESQSRGMPKALRPDLRDQIVKQLRAKLPKDSPGWMFFDLYARVLATLPTEAYVARDSNKKR